MDAGSELLQKAVPFFLLLILLELYVDRRRHTQRYRRDATWADLAVGTVAQVFDLLLKAAFLPVYVLVYERARLTTLASTPFWHWTVALLGVDFLYYVWHRANHEVRLLWAVHSVHHQSEDMNLAVALRQPAFQAPSVVLFFLPLALLGVSPTVLMLAYTSNLIYQFFIHTQAVRTLGPLEWLLNTPSHHRVHHGSNAVYLDKNYGGVLIVWDRLFGSFALEREVPCYGVTTPLRSFNPLWANLVELGNMVQESRVQRDLRGLLRVWFGHPALAVGKPSATPQPAHVKYQPPSEQRSAYIYWQAVLLFLVLNSAFLFVAHASPHDWVASVWAGCGVLWSALALAGQLERKPWLRKTEPARILFILCGAAYCGFVLSGPAAAGSALLTAAVLIALPALL